MLLQQQWPTGVIAATRTPSQSVVRTYLDGCHQVAEVVGALGGCEGEGGFGGVGECGVAGVVNVRLYVGCKRQRATMRV